MKRNFGSCLVTMAAVLASVSIASVPATAQEKTDQQKKTGFSTPGYAKKEASKPLPDGGPAPRVADGHPDLSGHWYVGLLGKEDALLVGSFGVEDSNVLPFDPKTTHEEKPSRSSTWTAAAASASSRRGSRRSPGSASRASTAAPISP